MKKRSSFISIIHFISFFSSFFSVTFVILAVIFLLVFIIWSHVHMFSCSPIFAIIYSGQSLQSLSSLTFDHLGFHLSMPPQYLLYCWLGAQLIYLVLLTCRLSKEDISNLVIYYQILRKCCSNLYSTCLLFSSLIVLGPENFKVQSYICVVLSLVSFYLSVQAPLDNE